MKRRRRKNERCGKRVRERGDGADLPDAVGTAGKRKIPGTEDAVPHPKRGKAGELFGMGLFNPQLADQSLAVLEMMDFDGKDKIVEKISQNQTLYTQLMAAQAQIQQIRLSFHSLQWEAHSWRKSILHRT